MDNVGSSDRAIRCLNIYGAFNCAPPFSPERSLATVVSEVIPSNTGDSCAQSKAWPFVKRSLRRTQLNSFVWPDRHAADGGTPLKSVAGESVRLIDSRSGQVERSCRTKLPTLDFLAQILPGRRNEIEQLLNLLGRPCDPVPPVFVYGPTATGKTSVVCEAMRVLRRPHAYVSCRSCHTSQLMYESILNQLVGQVRSATNNYSSSRKCDSLIDFAKHLPEACAQALSRKIALDKRLRSIMKDRASQRPV
jgi:hypothetical protein